MTSGRFILGILCALLIAALVPGASWAQSRQMYRQPPQPRGGAATVIAVDQPENCLRIRSGPGTFYDVIGCANLGDRLPITGVWTSNDWAQLANNGWVYGPQIQTDLRPPRAAYSQIPGYVVTEDITPDYSDWAYLPDYGYVTYWCGGLPVYFYNVDVWYRFHPWWWHRGRQAWWWHGGHHGRRAWDATIFRNFVRHVAPRSFFRNRSGIGSFNRPRTRRGVTSNRGFNRYRFHPRSSRAVHPRTFSNANRPRSRTFSPPRTFGSPSRPRSRTFSHPRTFSNRSFRSGHRGIQRSGGFRGGRTGGSGRVHVGGGRFGGRGHQVGGGRRHR